MFSLAIVVHYYYNMTLYENCDIVVKAICTFLLDAHSNIYIHVYTSIFSIINDIHTLLYTNAYSNNYSRSKIMKYIEKKTKGSSIIIIMYCTQLQTLISSENNYILIHIHTQHTIII